MSLNSQVPQQPSQTSKVLAHTQAAPDYNKLVRFLIQPFLENPDTLSVDCELSQGTGKVWIRVAFESEDKGRVFGRGGRNIQAIRTSVAAAATLAGHSAHVDIYGSAAADERDDASDTLAEAGEAPTDKRRISQKPTVKPRPAKSVN